MTSLPAGTLVWDLLLRGAVGGVLGFHLIHLCLPGPRAATRAALALFTLSLIAYLFCQRGELFFLLPRPLASLLSASLSASFAVRFDNFPAPLAKVGDLPFAPGFEPAADRLDTTTKITLIVKIL